MNAHYAPGNYQQPIPNPPGRRSFLQRRWPLVMGIVGAASCILALAALAGYIFLRPDEVVAQPLVLIHAPTNGDQLEIGQPATVHATARDQNNITRVELWVDGVLSQVESSNIPGGISPFPILASWQPTKAGTHTLTVRAFNSAGARSQGSITIEAIELTDRDSDGIADEIDICPDEASPTDDGCPVPDDRDNDGVTDTEDACPDESGWATHEGCPTPGDSDGDGVLDEEDSCPDEPGILDVEGCPDRDSDGIPDRTDADPDEPGPAETGGAPDTDGDTVPDLHDLDPEEPGDPGGGGVPDSDAPDTDGDGAADDVDPCPDEYGEPEDGYCPPPSSDPLPEDDGPIFDLPGVFFQDLQIYVTLELEAYEFRVGDEYDSVWCYVQVADEDVQRYEFEPEGDRFWNIREILGAGNSIHLMAPLDEPLPVFVNCLAEKIYIEEAEDDGEGIPSGGGWGTVYELGTFYAEHDSTEWDGRELLATGAGADFQFFQAKYRICTPTCDESELPPPILAPLTFGPRGEGPNVLRWQWDGNEELIDGFYIFITSTTGYSRMGGEPDQRAYDITHVFPGGPDCGKVLNFQVAAYSGDPHEPDRVSPRSNTQYWDGLTCPRTVVVSFASFDTAGLGSRQGPISGTFWANDEMLIAEFRDGPPSFDATDDTERYLSPGNVYNIASLFSDIEGEAHGCVGSGCSGNYAPSTNYLELELGPREALTFGANIRKEGGGVAFDGSGTIPAGEIVPGEYVVYDNGINMTVLIDVLIGPEAGDLPDLTISSIGPDEDFGGTRVEVFNNAADIVDTDIDVSLFRISTGELISTHTMMFATIPSGSSRSTTFMETEPHDVRAVVDIDDEIEEMDETNNTFETPVRMRVEFVQLRGGDPCENALQQEAEFWFRMWVGHRPPGGEVSWVGQSRYPETDGDTVDVRFHEDGVVGVTDPIWSLEGDPTYIFEFDMPLTDNLVILADGYEDDSGLAADDYLGNVFEEYSGAENFGHNEERYYSRSEGFYDCPDGPPMGYDFRGFHFWWRITRVH